MCDHGTTAMTTLHVDASVAHEGRDVIKPMPIDSCIADLVKSLDDAGYRMLGSCCGHGEHAPSILFKNTTPTAVPGAGEVERVLVAEWHKDQCGCREFDGKDIDTCHANATPFNAYRVTPPDMWMVPQVIAAITALRDGEVGGE